MQEYGFPLDRIFWYKYKIYDSALIMENMGQQKSEILVYFTQCVLIITQQTFQRCLSVVFWFIWRSDAGQRQINVETTLCILTFEFTTSCSVEPVLSISMLMWTTLDNVDQCRNNVGKMTISKKNKKKKKIISNRIYWIQSFNCYFRVFFTLLPILGGMCWKILAKLHWKNLI